MATSEKKPQHHEHKAHVKSDSANPLFGADLPLSAIQNTVAKMTLKASEINMCEYVS